MCQAWLHLRGARYTPPSFTQRGLYGRVRHPLMAGFVIIFWASPAARTRPATGMVSSWLLEKFVT